MQKFVLTLCAVCSSVFVSAREASGTELRFALVFQDRMVLQSDAMVPVWGWAEPAAEVTVTFAGQHRKAVAGADGYWRVNFDNLAASATGQTLAVSSGGSTIERHDVLVGEVWLCAGQSNMNWPLDRTLQWNPLLEQRLGPTDFPLIRFIVYPPYASAKPLKDMNAGVHGPAKWMPVNTTNALSSMALPFFFARKLHQELNVPVGLIQVAEGGTTQTAWSPREVIDEVADETGSKLTYEYLFQQAEERMVKISRMFKNWEDYAGFDDKWQRDRKGRYSPCQAKNYPCVLFNAQVHPLAPFAFRGVIWHQGEGGPTAEHEERMVALVTHWRNLFERNFFFIWGGLGRHTNFSPPTAPVASFSYRTMRNFQFLRAQRLFGYDGNSIFCDFYDLGNFNTHFGEKDKSGERFALAALTHAHGRNHVFTGPQLISSEVEPGKIRLKFTCVGSGLVYQPSFDGISGFILESGGDLAWVEPVIVAPDTLIFRHKKITGDSALYYAFHPNPHETLFNKEGFPASIFQVPDEPAPRRVSQGVPDRRHRADHIDLVEFINEPEKNIFLNITHVRRNVYVFRVTREGQTQRVSDKNCLSDVHRVRICLPMEWEDATVLHKDNPVELGPIKKHPDGQRTIEFDVETSTDAYVVCNRSKMVEALAEADCSRF